ncbi:MAG: hypothetical protein JSW20_12670 [Nitrospiraceae bacterium]|nr:MAG: hypothetical protein JSW20_12670 [Nitrospiraceae bacterium]
MASISQKYMMNSETANELNSKPLNSKKTALKHTMKINLNPLLEVDKSLFDHIIVFHHKEGKA